MNLQRKLTWPVPGTKKYDFIPNTLEIKQDANRFRLKNNRYLPPMNFTYSTYKTCARKLDDPMKDADLIRQKKLLLMITEVKEHIAQAKHKLKDLFLGYQEMIVKNKEQTDKCIKMLAEDIDTFKGLRKIYKKYVMACHSLLYVKDSMEEAVETYGDSASFIKEVMRKSPKGESVFNIHLRYKELMRLRQELGEDAKQEAEKHASLIMDLLQRHQVYYNEATLLHIKGKELETAMKELDCRISSEEQFMYAAHSWNERAWRHYSFINFTLYDILRYIIAARKFSPKKLQVSLWDKIQLIRREHNYNLEILKLSSNPNQKIDLSKLIDSAQIEHKNKKTKARRNKLITKKLVKLREKFKGHVPKMFKLLFKKLTIEVNDSKKTGQELLDIICTPSDKARIKPKPRHK